MEGYRPIEDHGLIGDGTTAALVGRDGSISWMCVPRFDSAPLFAGDFGLQTRRRLHCGPTDFSESRQFYGDDTGVLVKEMRGASGVIRLTDALRAAITLKLLELDSKRRHRCGADIVASRTHWRFA